MREGVAGMERDGARGARRSEREGDSGKRRKSTEERISRTLLHGIDIYIYIYMYIYIYIKRERERDLGEEALVHNPCEGQSQLRWQAAKR